jgi:hypothetical protein
VNETETLAAAGQRIDSLDERAEQHHAKLAEIRSDRNFTPEYRDQLTKQQRQEFTETTREAVLGARGLLQSAFEMATQRLSGPADEATELRKARAGTRVSRLLDGGMSPLAAAEVLAEAADLAGLRALREEIPSWVAATLSPTDQSRRREHTDAALLGVDRAMRPLLTGAEAAAVDVRLRVDDERARLDAVAQLALDNSPTNRVRLALASSPTPVMRDGRLEREPA